jgi:ATP-dependent Clp protease ATP-binding subunit ClpA
VIRPRVSRLFKVMGGEDGTEQVWPRLTPTGWEVVRLAREEARSLGHPCLADEHLLLGILRHGDNEAAQLLRSVGLDLDAARTGLARISPSMGPATDPAAALRSVGIEVDHVRGRLEATFGAEAVGAAQRRVRRRSRWRGGHPRPDPLCTHLLGKRALALAARYAHERGDDGIGPRHLLVGVLQDARDPLGTQLGRRSRRQLQPLGFTPGRANPVRLQLEAHGLELDRLRADLDLA